ncbi:MAG: hypothetical protein JWP08_4022, partial [Bryobacterales bacterium]|nr:hypothetical protein [Bryobacterales bacterium]
QTEKQGGSRRLNPNQKRTDHVLIKADILTNYNYTWNYLRVSLSSLPAGGRADS